MKRKLLFLLLPLVTGSLYAQDTETEEKEEVRVYGGFESNIQWYLNDSGRGIEHPSTPLRSNNYFLTNYQYGRFTAGFQIEAYEDNGLLNYNPGFKGGGVGTYYLNYKTEKLELTAGYFYEQFGSGLLLRAWEDRALGINTALRGGRVLFRPSDNVRLTALFGQQRTGFDVSEGRIYGFDSDINLNSLFKFEQSDLSFGVSYVGRYEKVTIPDPNFDELTNAFAGRINFIHNSFYISGEYNYKQKDAILDVQNRINNDFVKPGNAILLNFGYTGTGLGIDATVRRMENMSFLSEREPTFVDATSSSLNFNDKVLNFVPALTKQHHSNLANIYVFQAQGKVDFIDQPIMKAGETGGQIDIFYEFAKETALGGKYGTKIALNASSWYNLPGQYRFTPADYETNLFGVGEKYFSDYNLEIKKRLSETLLTNFYYINQYYNTQWLQGGEEVNSNIVTGEVVYNFDTTKSVRVEAEHMWADADRKNWAGGTVELNLNDKYSFYVWDIYNYGNDDSAKQTHYYNVGGAYRYGATRMALNYGRQRGGLVCVGGVCRFVPESTGFTVSLSTAF
ncbi:hypothetical protein DVK85_04265 [Flavobacterium arcticum]|uniref:Uncharacterized protein n=1 Tax=Flavobacterium arcticum TaxID=1784713 RepID=A0A345HA77_9FLAO|nr:DUF6029 family protein [Flavobacterium arcticum]AXG73487.1 hypothetical protein DVK85_04265 [Flavobacterium arcticum]KAF2513276.1 hypothetical protein E0W72_02315 [Flavobacterium arcticum]